MGMWLSVFKIECKPYYVVNYPIHIQNLIQLQKSKQNIKLLVGLLPSRSQVLYYRNMNSLLLTKMFSQYPPFFYLKYGFYNYVYIGASDIKLNY